LPARIQKQHHEQRLFNVDHDQHARAHHDAAEHHRLRLVSAAADHPGAVKYSAPSKSGRSNTTNRFAKYRSRPPQGRRETG
jgi:hypothetical protein